MTYSIDWVIKKFDKGEALKYIFFWGHSNKASEQVGNFVFSQWYPCSFIVDGILYKTTEHWMMAQKACLFNDGKIFENILKADKPGEVKELGRQIKGFDEIKWNHRKYEIVKTGNIHKFNQNKLLTDYLISTGDRIIVEASPTDIIWGIGLSRDSKKIDNPHTWRGQNLLGFALMEVREFLKSFGNFEYIAEPMLPPWKKYPAIDPMDLFWRMGFGEQYLVDLDHYFKKLSDNEKRIYELIYPAIGDWSNYYDN